MNLDFVKSRRFWALVLIAVIGVLKTEGIVSGEIADGLIIILSGFVGIRTIDRIADKVGAK